LRNAKARSGKKGINGYKMKIKKKTKRETKKGQSKASPMGKGEKG